MSRVRGIYTVAARFQRFPGCIQPFGRPAQVARDQRNLGFGNDTPRACHRLFLAKCTRGAAQQHPGPGKVAELDKALDLIDDGMTVGIGGWIFHSQPMALVRGIVRRGIKDLRLVPAPGSIAPDMLIAAGAVRETACVFISFEHLGLAPGFRRAAQSGAIKVLEMDGPGIAGGLRAGLPAGSPV